MTGTFPPNVQAGIKDISGTDGPKPENNIVDAKDNPAAGANGATDAPYSMQTGLTKFAPMQRKPGTKITLKSASAQYPTTPYTIAKTALPTPKQVTTITASPTYTVASMENTVSLADIPRKVIDRAHFRGNRLQRYRVQLKVEQCRSSSLDGGTENASLLHVVLIDCI